MEGMLFIFLLSSLAYVYSFGMESQNQRLFCTSPGVPKLLAGEKCLRWFRKVRDCRCDEVSI